MRKRLRFHYNRKITSASEGETPGLHGILLRDGSCEFIRGGLFLDILVNAPRTQTVSPLCVGHVAHRQGNYL